MLTFGSLFAGIGGFDLGLERAGMRCLWQCELDPYAERVLARHWPDVLRVRDIRDVNASTVPWVHVLAGGFPCQPVSLNGRRRGTDDERWLWPEFARAIRDLRPRYVLVENVPGLYRRLGVILADLATLGLDAEWHCIPAAAFGAPHRRDRVWIVAHASQQSTNGGHWRRRILERTAGHRHRPPASTASISSRRCARPKRKLAVLVAV